MSKVEKNYKIGFAISDPIKMNGRKMGKVYFTKDYVCFETRAEQMEFFDNPTKIFEHLRNTEVIRMITIRNAARQKVSPVIEIFAFLQTDGSKKFFFDERREVEVAIEETSSENNRVYDANIIENTHQKLFIDKDKEGEWDALPIKLT
jgi:hypothetical protein